MEPLGPLVEESLREPVACFRHDLYTPALAMLTGAVEGAFSESGLALADATETDHADLARRLRKLVTEPQTSLATLLDRVLAYYVDRDLSEPVWNGSGVAAAHMREVSIWAQGVRESRNVVHYRLRATLPNTYEKVASYLLAGLPGSYDERDFRLPGSIGRGGVSRFIEDLEHRSTGHRKSEDEPGKKLQRVAASRPGANRG